MADKPTIVVTNGTAGEGYWTVYYLLKTGLFNVRATARRLESPLVEKLKAIEFHGQRCEVVKASNEDQAALSKAFEGADGIYGTTIYDIHAKQYVNDNPAEMAQGKALIEAARQCTTLKHFVFQTMTKFEQHPEDIGQTSPIHFRTKWILEEMVQAAGLPWTLLRQPAYMRQIKFGLQFPNRLVWPYPPDVRLSFVAEEDLGKIAAQIFAHRDTMLNKTINGVSEVFTPVELVKRICAIRPQFKPYYRKATRLENAFFDTIIVGLRPAFRYVSQINGNLKVSNPFAMDYSDKQFCQELIAPLELAVVEDWLRDEFFAGKS